MVGFAESFWSGDYAGGMGVLFGKLQQGVIENQQVLAISRMRADAEEQYGRKLGEIAPTTDRMTGGFARDDGASLRKAYEGVRGEMQAAAENHKKIASNITELVVIPFSRWCEAHEGRIQNSQDDLQSRMKAHDKQAEYVRKLRSAYFNKCRQLEDMEEEDKLAFQDPEKTEATSPKIPQTQTPSIKVQDAQEEEEEEPIEIGDETFQPDEVKKILDHMLSNIKLGEAKVPILGTYQNVSTGSDITEYIQKHMGASSVSYAERVGQDLITAGFLRLIGSVGSTFANSSRMNYQWRPKVFKLTGIPEKRKPLDRVSSVGSTAGGNDSPIVGSMGEMLSTTLNSQWNPLNNQHPNETPGQRLKREANEADERYKSSVRRLDELRCILEEKMIDHFKFMERCELDRLKAIKAVILDFSGAISNAIPSLQSTVDNMMLYQETVQPAGDLRYLLENYRTGSFVPRVQVYDNYYNRVDEQTYGVDLEARARADRKRVPIIVTTILTFLDNHYPDLEGDEARRGIWLVDVPLAATHHLRNAINTGKGIPREVLERYETPIVASALKLYLLELPDSLVSNQVYEIIKTIYSSPDSSTSSDTRISVLQSTLGQLRLANIATLDALTTHFTRLIELTSADEDYVSALATNLAPCILRPRTDTSLTLHERHSYRLVRDLFAHKESIFGELKRASALSHTPSGAKTATAARDRAVSTDESNRRANMEARARAIASKSRAASPAPHANGGRSHRRDKSVDPPATRFPISTTSPTTNDARRALKHTSLEVPPDIGTPTAGRNELPIQTTHNGLPSTMTVPEHSSLPPHQESIISSPPSSTSHTITTTNPSSVSSTSDDVNGGASFAEKRESLGRATNSRFPPRKSGGHGSLSHNRMSGGTVGSLEHTNRDSVASDRGVQLTDKPMDD